MANVVAKELAALREKDVEAFGGDSHWRPGMAGADRVAHPGAGRTECVGAG